MFEKGRKDSPKPSEIMGDMFSGTAFAERADAIAGIVTAAIAFVDAVLPENGDGLQEGGETARLYQAVQALRASGRSQDVHREPIRTRAYVYTLPWAEGDDDSKTGSGTVAVVVPEWGDEWRERADKAFLRQVGMDAAPADEAMKLTEDCFAFQATMLSPAVIPESVDVDYAPFVVIEETDPYNFGELMFDDLKVWQGNPEDEKDGIRLLEVVYEEQRTKDEQDDIRTGCPIWEGKTNWLKRPVHPRWAHDEAVTRFAVVPWQEEQEQERVEQTEEVTERSAQETLAEALAQGKTVMVMVGPVVLGSTIIAIDPNNVVRGIVPEITGMRRLTKHDLEYQVKQLRQELNEAEPRYQFVGAEDTE